MILRLLLCVALGCSLTACTSPTKKKEAEKKLQEKQEEEEAMEDISNDPDFQSFLSRLRTAAASHDMDTIASMMTTNFGYRLDPVGEGDGVFKYWDDQNLWPQLQTVLNQKFVPKGSFMVAPPEFSTDPKFHGYRAGIASVDGVWKFAYFVTD